MERRFRRHAEGKGAKYFRGRLPVKVVLLESGHTRSSAATREAQVKSFSHAAKMLLIEEAARGRNVNTKEAVGSGLEGLKMV
jgi:putative endonuclease